MDRHTVERGFGRLKHWRPIATRHDEYATIYLGGVLLRARSSTTAPAS
jgi:putative transposase